MKIKMDLPESDKKLMQEKKMVRSLSIYETGERERERERESKSDETCESFLSNL